MPGSLDYEEVKINVTGAVSILFVFESINVTNPGFKVQNHLMSEAHSERVSFTYL